MKCYGPVEAAVIVGSSNCYAVTGCYATVSECVRQLESTPFVKTGEIREIVERLVEDGFLTVDEDSMVLTEKGEAAAERLRNLSLTNALAQLLGLLVKLTDEDEDDGNPYHTPAASGDRFRFN